MENIGNVGTLHSKIWIKNFIELWFYLQVIFNKSNLLSIRPKYDSSRFINVMATLGPGWQMIEVAITFYAQIVRKSKKKKEHKVQWN